jgi:hypothetical protein
MWLIAGVAGSLSFWLFQVLTDGATITEFMGEQIATEGSYPMQLAPLIGWGVHLGVSLANALLFTVIMAVLRSESSEVTIVTGLSVVLPLAWVTTLLTTPAIAATISVLSGKGFPAELPEINTKMDLLVYYNHLLFFGVVWVFVTLIPELRRFWRGW